MMAPRVARTVVLLASLLGALGTARLGFWQLDRAGAKLALQAEIAGRSEQPVLPAAALARDAATAAAQHYRRIELRGRWLPRHTVYLDNRQMNARPGFFVVTPLLLAPGDAVLVQRGWLPRDAADRTRLAPVSSAQGEVKVSGRVAPAPSRLFELGADDHGVIRQNLDLASFAREIGLALRPLSVQQLDGLGDGVGKTAGGAGDGLLRQWPAPVLDVAKHHGYAFQWFALSALITGLYVWFQLIHPRSRRAA